MQKFFSRIEKIIKESSMSKDEKEELWKIVEEIVHHRVMGCVLDTLPREHHEEFLNKMAQDPASDSLIEYVEEKTGEKVSEKIKKEVELIEEEILNDLN